MKIQVSDLREDPDPLVNVSGLETALRCIIEALKIPDGDIEVTCLDSDEIKELNRTYRGIDSTTNVLSFPQYTWSQPETPATPLPQADIDSPPLLLGEVILSPSQIHRDAEESGINFFQELIRISIHGILHLFGYDHCLDPEAEIMEQREAEAFVIWKQLPERVDAS
jgi:probable rRNA maturation factor